MEEEKKSGENTIYSEINYLWDAMSSAQQESISVKESYTRSIKDANLLKTRISHLEKIIREKSDIEKELKTEIMHLKEKIDSDKNMVEEAREISLKLAETPNKMHKLEQELLAKDKTGELLRTKILQIEGELENSKKAIFLKEELIEELQLKIKGIFSLPEISAAIEKELREEGKFSATTDSADREEKRTLLENLLYKLQKEEKLNREINASLSELNAGIQELKSRNQQNVEANKTLLLEIKDRETKIEELRKMLDKETTNSNAKHQKNLQLQGEINSMNLKIEGLKKDLSETLEGNETLGKTVLEKDGLIKEINGRIRDSELKIEKEKQNFADAVRKIFSLQSKLSELRESLNESQEENKKLSEIIHEKNNNLEKVNALHRETSLKFRQEKETSMRSLNRISALQSEIDKMKEVIVRGQEYSRELAQKLRDKEEHAEMLKKELDKIDVLQIEVEELKKRNRKITSIVQQEQFEFIQRISKSLEKLSGELKSIGLRVPVLYKQNLTVSDKNLLNVISLLKTYQDYLDESMMETQPQSIRNILEQMLGQWEKSFRMKRLFVKPKIQANTPYCKVNPEKLKTAFNQVIKNSHEAMGAGGILTVTLSADEERKFVYVKFEDNGPGFTPAAIENMFIPFFTTKKEHIGIGLCTARKIAEKLNGELSITNKNERGKVTGVVVEFKFPASYEKDMPQP